MHEYMDSIDASIFREKWSHTLHFILLTISTKANQYIKSLIMSILNFHAHPQFFGEDLFSDLYATSRGYKTRQPFNYTSGKDHNVAETETSFQLAVDLPGVKAADIALKFDEGILKISGTRKFGGQQATFLKSFVLDQATIDTANATANLADGVLVVTVPKRAKPATQSVAITENPHNDWVAVETSEKMVTEDTENSVEKSEEDNVA